MRSRTGVISTVFLRIGGNIKFLLAIDAKRVARYCSLIAVRALFGLGSHYQHLALGFFASLIVFGADGFENCA